MPVIKLRRLRQKGFIRDWVSEARLYPEDLILPYFVVDGKGIKEPIVSMPGISRFSIDNLIRDISETRGIRSILLFGVSHKKDISGSEAHKKDGIVQSAVRALKREFKDLVVITDVCLCGYTSNGHCGIVKHGKVDNDASVKALARIALSHAEAGADFVAPSAMMDGQVGAIREALDRNRAEGTAILAYSAKYASNFYAPFRDALNSRPQFGDRRGYQMDFRNSDEALREIREDVDEGADIVMIKPALSYLDIIHRAKKEFKVPIAAYNVSGEYAMVKEYVKGIEDIRERAEAEKGLSLEILTSIKRAGADFIITYWAKELARWLR